MRPHHIIGSAPAATRVNCKSAVFRLRRFESYLPNVRQPYGITAVQQVLALLEKVRLLLGQQDMAPWCNGSTADFGSAGGGSNPSGACYMEFVAQLVERQNVDLMVAGSKPVKLPRGSVELRSSFLATRPYKYT